MKLQVMLKRIGVEIAKESIKKENATVYLRVDPDYGAQWVEVLSAFLLGAQGKTFKVDASKYFYPEHGELKYLWRFYLSGEVDEALQFFGSCVQEVALTHARQFESFPLVGRATYEFNPAKGKLKGGHHVDEAAGILSMAIGGGPGAPQ